MVSSVAAISKAGLSRLWHEDPVHVVSPVVNGLQHHISLEG
jgi:hypothetical protein